MLLASCHAQSVAATNRVTGRAVSWLTIESFCILFNKLDVGLIDNMGRLGTKKGLQGGKTIQQGSDFFALSRPIVGSDESCDRAVKLVGS